MDRPRLNPALKEFWETPARYKILYGGRSSSKSTDSAAIAILMAQKCKIRVLCARMFQTNIKQSVYSLLVSWIERFGIQEHFTVTDSSIVCNKTGSQFIFYGVARNLNEIKGLEGIDILWLEESNYLSKDQLDVILPTIRKEGSQVWMIFNPGNVQDYVWQNFVVNPQRNSIVKKINYTENPFLSNTMMEQIEDCRINDPAGYEHHYLGEPLTDDDLCIIKRTHLLASIDAHIKLGISITGQAVLGYDPADGGDENACVVSTGSLITQVIEWKAKENEMLTSARRALMIANEANARIVYDPLGVGASLYQVFAQAGSKSHSKFIASGGIHKPDSNFGMSGIKNKDLFANLKAQAWFLLSKRFENTYNAVNGIIPPPPIHDMAFISSDINNLEKLINELSTPRRMDTQDGKILVERKIDLKKRGIPSHNLADSAVMSLVRFSSGLFS